MYTSSRFLARMVKAPSVLRTVRTSSGNAADMSTYKYETLSVTVPQDFVLHVELNRPEKMNAMNNQMWKDMIACFNSASQDENVRAIIISGKGKMFTAGLDLMSAASLFAPDPDKDVSRKAFAMMQFIRFAQDSCNVIEKCNKPVIAAIHNGCIGAGVDTITACDIRLQTSDAYYCVKEVDVGLAADVGTLQRLPKVIGNDSLARELCYTARKMEADEAKSCGLVSKVYGNKEDMIQGAVEMAGLIASKSPVAVQGTKHHLVYSRDHTVKEGLEYMVSWNSAMLQSEDIVKSAQAFMMKQTPADIEYSKL